MKLLMMGTGPFAVPTFEALVASSHDVPALVTRPTPPARGRRKSPPNPMRDAAEHHGLPVLAPDDINSEQGREIVASFAPQLLVVCDYGQILSNECLAVAHLGGVNLHASLLPKYRGAAPINWALYDGETETGVTVIHMTPQLDAGPCLLQVRTPIDPDEDAVELERRLAQIGAEAVLRSIEMLAGWDRASTIGQRQDSRLATKARRLRKDDAAVDWSRTARQIRDQVRAFKPWPGAYTHLLRADGEPLRLILDAVSVVEAPTDAEQEAAPGTVVHADGRRVEVATGAGLLAIDRIQPAGKRVMEIDEFLRGHTIEAGNRFGSPDG
ncbi:MAG: methionyl-tRNA formyltransferase [Pirellulaceae bacterium]